MSRTLASSPGRAAGTPYLRVEDVALLLGRSTRSIHELTRLGRIPHRRIAGTRRLVFIEHELLEWIDQGTELKTITRRDGTRIVRPVVEPAGLGRDASGNRGTKGRTRDGS